MDWLRRNWPDLLIGIALIAVIAGIVATLLTGGSFFPLGSGQQGATPTTPNVSPVAPPSSPVTVPGEGAPGTPPVTGTPTPATPGVPTPGAPVTGDPVTPSAETETPQTGSNGAIAVLPPTPGGQAPADQAPATGEGAAAPSGQAESGAAVEAVPPTSPATPIATGDSAPTAPFRVSVGAFGSEANAQGQAATFRQAGFPVFLGRQGDLVLVLVGPYDTQAEAEQAVSRIRSGDFGIDPVIYRFQPDEDAAGAAAIPAQPDAAAAPETPAPEPAAEPATESPAPPTSSDGTFLQVGAYANSESALPQVQRLESLGFEVSERLESGLVKLLIGPFGDDALPQARARLQAEGIENFPRQ